MSNSEPESSVPVGDKLEAGLSQPETSSLVIDSPTELAHADLQYVFGNALLGASATSGTQPDPTKTSTLQHTFGNATVARMLIQRKADGNETSTANATPSPGETQGAGAAAAVPSRTLIVEDTAETVQPEQMKKTEFLTQLRSAVRNAATDTPGAAGAGPQLDAAFARYSTQTSQQLERTIHAQMPEATAATTATALIQAIVNRASRSLAAQMPSAAGGGLLAAAGSAVSSVSSGIASAASGVVAGVGSALSGLGNILFKERNDSSARHDDPATVQSQLGGGHSLESGVKSRMESAYGQSFNGVEVHTDANAGGLSDNMSARAFTVGQHIAFGAGEYQPGTLIGDALIAHELAHVVQQRAGAVTEGASQKGENAQGALEQDADEAAVGAVVSTWGGAKKGLAKVAKKALPGLKSGLRLQRCDLCSSQPVPTPRTDVKFSELLLIWPTLTTAPQKEAALLPAIASARRWASELFRSAGGNPIRAIRQRIEGGAIKVDVEDNPLIGVTQDNVEQAYRSWAQGAGVEPWILLALWAKEGIGKNVFGGNLTNPADVGATITASTPDNARSLYRSRTYYMRTGMDHFMHTTASTGDNRASFLDADAAAHEATFRAAVAAQVAARRLPSDVSSDINAQLTVTAAGAGRFQVTPSNQFFSLSLLLAGAYYRENAAALAADPRIGANPDPGLVYMRWNMGATRFAPFIPSAEGHRMEPQYTMPGPRQPSLTEWAFEREPKEDEFGQSRRNAIRFRYFVEVFHLIYEGW